jgi:hypothetical protein
MYKTLYDFTNTSLELVSSLYCLALLGIGLYLLFYKGKPDNNKNTKFSKRKKITTVEIKSLQREEIKWWWIKFIFGMGLTTCGSYFSYHTIKKIPDYYTKQEICKNHTYQIVEGYVYHKTLKEVKKGKKHCHFLDFDIDTIHFALDDYYSINGCMLNDLSPDEIRDAVYLKITYLTDNPKLTILKIEKRTKQ